MADQIQTLTTVYESKGLAQAAAEFDKVTAATTKASSALTGVNTVTVLQERSTLSAAKALEAFTRKNDELSRVQAQIARAEIVINDARRQGVTITTENERALANLRARYDELTAGANDNARAIHGHSAALSLNRNQQLELAHVSRALFDQIAAGQDPLRAFAVESGRIGQLLSSGQGGVGGTVKALASSVGSLLTGWVGLGIGIAASVGIAGFAVSQFEERQNRLSLALNGVGRAAGVSLDELNKISLASAKVGGITSGQSSELIAGFVGTGKIDGGLAGSLAGLTKRYSKGTGQDIAAGGDELAKAFADPSTGADKLAERLGNLDARTRETIRNFQEQGNLLAAQRVLYESTASATDTLTDRTGTLTKAWEGLKSAVSGTFDGIGAAVDRITNGLSPIEKTRADLERLRAELKAAQTAPGFEQGRTQSGTANIAFGRYRGLDADQNRPVAVQSALAKAVAEAEAKLAALEKTAADAALNAKRAKDANDLSLKVDAATKSILAEIDESQGRRNRIELLRAGLSDPLVTARLSPEQRAQATQAGSNLSVVQAFSDPLARLKTDAALALESINATSLAERIGVEARKAQLSVLRESGDLVRASIAAESARNQEIAKANKAADELNEKSKQNAALSGLSPYERRVAEINNRYSDFRDKNVSSRSEISEAVKPLNDDLATGARAVRTFTDSLTAAAARILGIGGVANNGVTDLPLTGIGSAADLIKRKEGFRSGAYYDVNAFRVGYGSDTTTAPDGTVSRVTASTTVSKEDAERDLSRRIAQSTSQVIGSIGPNAFSSLGTNGQAALTSVAYNYGRLPSLVASAARSGDPLLTGNAIAGLANDNNGVNRARRLEEANLASGGRLTLTAGATAQEANKRDLETERRNSINDPFKAATQSIADFDRQTTLLRSTFGLTEAQIKGATDAEALRTKYINDGILTAKTSGEQLQALNDNIKAVGDASAGAAQRRIDTQRQQQDLIGSLDSVRSSSNDLISSPLKAFARGQDPGKALRSSLAGIGEKLIDSGAGLFTNSLFGKQGTAGGGLFGGLLGGLVGGGAQSVAQQNVTAGIVNIGGSPISNLLGGGGASGGGGGLFGSLFGGLFGGGGLGAATHIAYATGGIHGPNGSIMPPLRRFAGGGISDTAGIFGEAGPEAAVPLPDGRSIPVTVRGGRSSAPNVVSIKGGDVIIQGNATPDMLPAIMAKIDANHQEALGAVARSQKELSRGIGGVQSRYNKQYG